MNEEEKESIEILKEIEINTYAEGKAIAIDTVLKLIKKLQKENESWKSYSEELEEKNTEISNKKCELEFEVEELQKENKELKKENEELNLKYYMLYTGKIENLKAQEVKIKSQVIPVQKVKDKIEELKQEKKKYGNCLIEMYEDELVNRDIKILQELLEGRK